MFSNHEIDMTQGSITKKMILFALPLIMSSFLQLLFNEADIAIVGRFGGDEYLAAVGAATAPCRLLTNILIGISTGVNILVGKAIGSGNDREISKAIHTAAALGVIIGIVIGILGILISEKLLIIMGTPEEILSYSLQYMRILYAGAPLMAEYNFLSAVLRARGDTFRPLIILSFAGIVNIICNLFFVIVLKLNVVGVALATIISQGLSMMLILMVMLRESGAYRLHPGKAELSGSYVKGFLLIGIPSGIEGSLFSLSNMVIQSSINSFGEIVMAGSSASNSLEHFAFAGMNSFSQAGVSFASQNIGAEKYGRIPEIFRKTLICNVLSGSFWGGLLIVFGRTLLSIYTRNDLIIEQGMLRLMYLCGPYILCGASDSLPGIVRSMGHPIIPTVITLSGTCIFRIIWILTVCQLPAFDTVNWVYMSYGISWFLTFVIHYISYRWAYKKIKHNSI